MALPFRDINVQTTSSSYLFSSPSSPNAPALTIDRPSGDVGLGDASLLAGKRVSRVTSIAGILGMIQLRLDKYVIIITKAQPVGRLRGHMVYKIISTDLLPLRERQVRDPDEDRFLSLLKNFIRSGPMYFSYSVDLTSSFQRQSRLEGDPREFWEKTDERFFWNRFVQSDLIKFATNGGRNHPGPQAAVGPYILPVIFGMLEIHQTTFKQTPLTIALITRRSRHRGGTRYFSRGIDEEGHVSNYNETEQVVILNDVGSGMSGFAGNGVQSGRADGKQMQIMSYVQTRGSVPVYWAEINTLHYTPKLQIRGIDSAFPAAAAHFKEQIQLYGDNYMVNLVNQKGREKRVKDAYEQVVEMLVSSPQEITESGRKGTNEKFHTIEASSSQSKRLFDRLHYIYFDFHTETKGMRLDRAQLLIDRMQEALQAQGYFRALDSPVGGLDGLLEVRSQQTSVVRSNCMDCLDRTNVVQSMMARYTLDRIFVDLRLMPRGSTFKNEDPAFEHLYRNLWADNADTVSKSYSGTGAMKTDMTRLGKRTQAGALRDGEVAVERYVRNNFLDGPRQDAFDLFLGAYQPGTAALGSNLVFADRRPILIQSIPYVLAFSFFLVVVGMVTTKLPDSAVWPLRLFTVFWTAVSVWCARFVFKNGVLYVNWPKLNPRPYVAEGYQDAITKIRSDPVIGSFVAKHERGLSTQRYLSAEEGKKRIE